MFPLHHKEICETQGKKVVSFLWHDMAPYSSNRFLKSDRGDPFYLSIYYSLQIEMDFDEVSPMLDPLTFYEGFRQYLAMTFRFNFR